MSPSLACIAPVLDKSQEQLDTAEQTVRVLLVATQPQQIRLGLLCFHARVLTHFHLLLLFLSYACSHVCALLDLLQFVLSQCVCALMPVLSALIGLLYDYMCDSCMCSHVCVLICVHMFAVICVQCSHVCALSHFCSNVFACM